MLIPFNELFARHHIKTPGALHLGANLGQEATAYAAQGIGRVIWVEALPEVHAVLRKQVAGYPGSVALCACVSDVDGEPVEFNVANNEAQSSSFLQLGTHAQEHPSVKYIRTVDMLTVRTDTLLANEGLDVGPHWFLNVDLQGAELKALKGMGELLWQFDHAYIEVNERELYQGCPLVREIDDYLASFGFVGLETKMMPQGWGDRYYQRA